MIVFSPAVKNREIRMALVGCGRISKNHIEAIRRSEGACRLVGVCDIDAGAAARVADVSGATPHTRLSSMLSDCNADVVILTTPSGLHAAQALEVAASGRHVITEKPMATRWEDGKRMVRACDEAGVRLFVVKQNRNNATLQSLKRAVLKGRFGRINMVSLNVYWQRPQEYYDSAGWRGTWEYDGGALMNQASHYVDLLEWLVGPVESVYAYTATLGRAIEVEDTAVVAVRWRSGALGTLNVTMLAYPQNLEGSVTILGDRGTARIGGIALNQIQEWKFAEVDEDDERIADVSYQGESVYGLGHVRYYQNVVRVLKGEADPETDGREGLKSLQILTAAYRSARDGVRISLPLES